MSVLGGSGRRLGLKGSGSAASTPSHSARVLHLSSGGHAGAGGHMLPLSPHARLGFGNLSAMFPGGAGSPLGMHAAPSSAANGAGVGVGTLRPDSSRARSSALTDRHLHTESPTPSPIDFTARHLLQQQQMQQQQHQSRMDVHSAMRDDAEDANALLQADADEAMQQLMTANAPRVASSRALQAQHLHPHHPSSHSSVSFHPPPSSLSMLTTPSPAPLLAGKPAAVAPHTPSSKAKLSSLSTLPFKS